MLSTFTWNNTSGGDFSDAADWNGPNGTHTVPGSGDDAVIPSGDYAITVSSSTTVNSVNAGAGTTIDITGGTLAVLNAGNQPSSTFANLMVASGTSFTTSGGPSTVDGTGTIAGNLDVQAGGTLDIAPTNTPFSLDAGATLTGPGTFNAESELDINASITAPTNLVLDSPNANEIDGPGTLTVPSGATLTWTAGSMVGIGGTTDIASGGTLLINGNTPVSLQDRALNNDGTTIDSATGSLSIAGQAVFTNSGAFAITNDAAINGLGVIDNDGTITKASPSGSGTTVIDTTFNNAGTVTATSGILQINGSGINTAEFNDPTTAGSIDITSPNGYDLNAGSTYTGNGALELNTSNGVTINGSLTFPNLTVASGTIEGTGSIYITGTLATSNATIENTGSLNLPNVATLTIFGANQTTTFENVTVNDSGTTTLSGTDSFALAGTAIFNNAGKFTIENDTVSGDGGNFNLQGATFNNSGLLLKTTPSGPSGLSDITGGLFYNTGEVSAASGQLQLDVQGTNSGNLDSESGATVLLTQPWNLNAGTTLTGPGLFENGNGTVGNGTIDVNASVSANRFKFVGGTMNIGPGATFTVTTLNFAGGTIEGTGTVAIPANGLVGFTSPTGVSIAGTTLAIAGSATWTNIGGIQMNSGAVISVNAGATFTASNDQAISGGSGGTFNVYGSLVKTSLTGVGTTTIGVTTNILPGGSINLVSGNLATNTLTNVGTIALGSETVLSVTGTFTQPNAGTLNIAIGGAPATGLFGQIDVSSTGSLNGTLNVTRANSYVPIVGQVYPVMTFSARTGNFTRFTTPNNGLGALYSASPQSAGFNILGTTGAPTSPTGLTILAADDTGGAGVTAVHAPRLTGTAQPGLQIQIYHQNVLVGTGVVAANGTFVTTMLSPLAPGTYALTAVSIDTLGDYSPTSQPLTLTITPPPAAPTGLTLYPADDNGGTAKTSVLQPRLTGTAAANSLVQIYATEGSTIVYLGGGYANASGTFVITPVAKFAVGTYHLFAVAIDAGGNYGLNSSPFTLTIT